MAAEAAVVLLMAFTARLKATPFQSKIKIHETGWTTLAKKDKEKENGKTDAEEKPRETTVEFLASLAAVLVTGLFIITFVVQAFEIPSSSMEDTLLIGDHVFVNRIVFAPKTPSMAALLPYRNIHHGDIVVFLHPDPH
ncbi:MAG: S26 family signal peptidase, partial [Candidatus Sulfotelmatobacter sp.]